MKYRKKTTVEAIRYDGQPASLLGTAFEKAFSPDALSATDAAPVYPRPKPAPLPEGETPKGTPAPYDNALLIKTPRGAPLTCSVGDYLVLGEKGQYFTVNQATFEAQYEAAT